MIQRAVQELCQVPLKCNHPRKSFRRFIDILQPYRTLGGCVVRSQNCLAVSRTCLLHRQNNISVSAGYTTNMVNIFHRHLHTVSSSVSREEVISDYWKPSTCLYTQYPWKQPYTALLYQWYQQCTCPPSVVLNSRHYATKAQTTFTLRTKLYRDYLQSLEVEYKSLLEMKDSSTGKQRFGHSENMRVQTLKPLVEVFQKVKEKYDDLEELEHMAKDEEMRAMVEEEVKEVLSTIEELEDKLVSILTPPEKSDDCDIILEVECGAGGLESMLFAEEILNMYASLSHRLGWQFEIIELEKGDKGYISASASISGKDVYQQMKFEGGVHRVQRVPTTERGGRMHTSTVAVAILPQPKEIDIDLNKRDLKIESMKSSGPGGQNVNKVNTAVRMVHIPTGIVVECQESRSNVENQRLALRKLKSRLYELQLKEQTSSTDSKRKIQVGNKDRNEKIRTYNYVQDRITDHRIGYSISHLSAFMDGGTGLTDIMDKLQEGARYEGIKYRLEEFEKSVDSKKKVEKKK